MGFSRQEHWSGMPRPPPGNLPNPGMEPASLTSPALTGRFFTNAATWEAVFKMLYAYIYKHVCFFQGFPGDSVGKESTSTQKIKETRVSPLVWKISWRRARQPTRVFFPGESHGQRTGGLQSKESQRVGHDWSNWACMRTCVFQYVHVYICIYSLCVLHSYRDILTWSIGPLAYHPYLFSTLYLKRSPKIYC